MISLILLSILTTRGYGSDDAVCTMENNPICCPDPKHYPNTEISDYRPYGNVCEYSYGIDPNTKKAEDPFMCGYGTCPKCACTMIYRPVCCNGIEYANECEADCDGQKGCTDGACPETCPCTLEWRPVCCPDKDDTEYGNPCLATCDGLSDAELIACHYGTCERPETDCICTTEYNPYCCNGEDYASPCVAECDDIDISTCTKGICEVCACTADYFPVCCPSKESGGPRQTYANSCAARCERSEAELLECYYGECPTCVCPMMIDPVCCDGTEYGNQCEADCEKAIGCNKGRCPQPATVNNDDQGDSYDDNDKEEKPEKTSALHGSAMMAEAVCACTLDYKPMCCKNTDPWSDIKEVTYGNQCEAECAGADMSTCIDDECESSLCVCTREYNAVCCPRENGEPGEQFSNPCTASCVKSDSELIDCHYGVCADQCACPFIMKEVCCAGKQYDNECLAKCSGEELNECSDGKCPVACPLIYEPYCCNGEEYSNKCMADADDATGCKQGECETCNCNLEYKAVCCGDITYGNQCQARCADEDLVECDYGECGDNTCDCKEKEDPVCCNGKDEYKNKCLARCANEPKDSCKKGKCSGSYADAIVGVPHMETNVTGLSKYGFNVNTIILGLILVAMVSFVCVYYKRTDPAQFRKQINYDTDQ